MSATSKKRVAILGGTLAGLVLAQMLEDRFDVRIYATEPANGDGDDPLPLLFDPARDSATASLVRKLALPTVPFVPSFAVARPSGPPLLIRQPNKIEGGWRPSRRVHGQALRAVATAPTGERRPAEAWLDLTVPEREVRETFLLPLASAATGLADRRWRNQPTADLLAAWRSAGPGAAGAAWQRVPGGTRAVLTALAAKMHDAPRAIKLHRTPIGIDVLDTNGGFEQYDAIVLALPPTASMQLLPDAGVEERRALAGFQFATRRVVLHDDARWAPADGASIGVVARDGVDIRTIALGAGDAGSFVTLDAPAGLIDAASIRQDAVQNWILPDTNGHAAQARLESQQGHNRTWYVGAHLADGTPRGTIESAAALAQRLH